MSNRHNPGSKRVLGKTNLEIFSPTYLVLTLFRECSLESSSYISLDLQSVFRGLNFRVMADALNLSLLSRPPLSLPSNDLIGGSICLELPLMSPMNFRDN
ncbi:hypothetical protein SPLC1_S208760 [Arthrospira platensis C1]|nr:hypothetical protein SPLC1_S208760 [Arthrospira platensis C1]